MKVVRSLLVVAVLLAVSSTARAQLSGNDTVTAVPDTAVTAVAESHAPVASVIDRPDAMRRPANNAALMPMASTNAGLGQSKAMMLVGGAALITGAIIGGEPGTFIMVGGAVVGLYGLYKYLQ